jgi:hypothetical protein
MSLRILLCLAALLGPAAFARAQVEPDEDVPVARPGPAPRPGPAQPEATAAPNETPRTKIFQTMPFDRRPSAVLKMAATTIDTGAPPGSDKVPLPQKLSMVAQTLFAPLPLQRVTSAAALGTMMSLKDPLQLEMAEFHRQVTLGEWKAVRAYLQKRPKEEAVALHKRILQALPASSNQSMGNPQMAQFAEKNAFSQDDLLGLLRAAPAPLDKDAVKHLSTLLQQAVASGAVIENIVKRLQEALAEKEGLPIEKLQIAQMIVGAGQAAYAGSFLPPLDEAIKARNDTALDLLAENLLGRNGLEAKVELLEKAWQATQAVLGHAEAKRENSEKAFRRAVALAPRLKERYGQAWLEHSFTKDRQRGHDILSALSASVGPGMTTQPFNPDMRHKTLQLQKTAVEALLKTIPKESREWESELTLLAVGWLKEAEFTNIYGRTGRLGPRIQRDRFGNVFFYDDDDPFYQFQMRQERNLPRPIEVGEMLETRPNVAWIDHVEASYRPKLAMLICQLFLKGGEEKDAFPYIEKLAATHPEKARNLVHEFLRVWIRTHDLNESRRGYNPFIFMYGFMSRAESIPLTRSKQERNLHELTDWVARLRKLPIGDIDDDLLARAFTASHSNAEVFRVELIESVFGPVGGLKPKAIAHILQQMRENLGSTWREPAVQKDKKTNRKQKDIQVEVLRGYELALKTTEGALAKHPRNWELLLARAALKHDENNYRQELEKSSLYSARRQEAFDDFRAAAQAYAANVATLADNDQTSRAYEQWFYASLGACDIGQIKEDKVPDARQPAFIRKAIDALPGDLAEKHMTKFVNSFVTKTGAVKAPVKYRYLKAGLEIVGDHKFAHDARRSFEYYKDLITEIKLETVIDGSDVVGHGKPFGLLVQLRHTREIERESGGFSRYLQNQNSNIFFAYNFGRPTTDYRDRFHATVEEALKEHFEVISVTFQTENVNSRATRDYGWRITPYAYILLKARGPQVDKVPPLKLDLDFLDTAGYVVLPIDSPPLPIDASPAKGQTRPVRELQITQTLDERQADKGKLVLEIKAVGMGLVPELETLVDLKAEGFEVTKTDDPGVSVSKFHPDNPEPAVVSERLWTVHFKPEAGQQPQSFAFAQAKAADAKMIYQRFEDADLVTVAERIDLEQRYGSPSYAWVGWVGAGSAAVLVVVIALVLWLRRAKPAPAPRYIVPEVVTPFSVLHLLETIQKEDGLAADQRTKLAQVIAELQQRYFKDGASADVDLKKLAQSWVLQTKRT